jgi:hypothetical protein
MSQGVFRTDSIAELELVDSRVGLAMRAGRTREFNPWAPERAGSL